MQILIVGAGAVGQVYGLHLAQAGHAVSFFVRPKYVAEVQAGLTLHRLGRRRHITQTLRPARVLGTVSEVAAARWDQVWLALPSDALRTAGVEELLRAVGAATVVCLQPDIEDGDRVRALVPPAQVVQGLIPFISFQSPLPGRDGPQGMAYYLPPFVPTLLAGPAQRTAAVYAALRAGGLRARRVDDFARATATTTAMFQSLIATLETGDWKLSALGGSPVLAPGLAAARQAVAIAARHAGGAATLQLQPLLRPLAWRLLLPLVPRLFPFDIEVYLKYHFSKVGRQTRLMLDSYIALGAAQGQPRDALERLRAALPALD